MEGAIYFTCSCVAGLVLRAVIQSLKKEIPPTPFPSLASPPLSLDEVYHALERRVQKDEGCRGIAELIIPGQLKVAVDSLLASSVQNVVIITGFPCLIDQSPPTETDGPLGALAIARFVVAFDPCYFLL